MVLNSEFDAVFKHSPHMTPQRARPMSKHSWQHPMRTPTARLVTSNKLALLAKSQTACAVFNTKLSHKQADATSITLTLPPSPKPANDRPARMPSTAVMHYVTVSRHDSLPSASVSVGQSAARRHSLSTRNFTRYLPGRNSRVPSNLHRVTAEGTGQQHNGESYCWCWCQSCSNHLIMPVREPARALLRPV